MVSLPKALLGPLRAEKEMTALQESVWSEGRGGADLLLEAPSGQETTVALSVFLLEQLMTALESAEATKPRRYSRASAIAAKLIAGAGGRDRIGSDDDEKKPKLHSLVLTRNREIAASLAQALVRLGKEIPNLAVATLVGGVPVAENNKTLKGGCHIAVGTPGRVKFLIQKGTLLPESGKTLVLESADWLIAPVFMEDVGYVVGKFPEEKQVVATSTVEASSIEEGLCALLGVPELHRIGTDGSVRKSGVRMPSCSPPPRAPTTTTGVSDRRLPSQGHVRAAGEACASRGPGAPMTLALSAKERLLEETRNALRISTARAVSSSSGEGKARSPPSVASDSRLAGTSKRSDRAPPPYSTVSSGIFSNFPSSKSNERVLSGAASRRNSAGGKVGGNAGACGCDAGLLGAMGAQDDDCASTLDLLSPGALHGSEGIRAVVASGAVVNPVAAAVAVRGDGSNKTVGLARVPEHREQRQHHDGQRDDGQHQPFVDSPATGTASLEELDIPPVLLASLAAEGVTAPTPLQASVWTAGRGSHREDLLVHGRPGDETATAYSVPILECVLERCSPEATRRHGEVQLQALVLTRTRDMAANVSELLLRLGRGMQGLAVATLVGGVPVAENSRSLAGGCHVAVGTPGRVRFLMSKGLLRPWPARTLVLDSADWLMAPIFQEDVGWIASRFAKERQILAFSGAEPSAIQESLGSLVGSPRLTSVGGESSVVAAAPTSRTPLDSDEEMADAAVATTEAEALVTHDAGKIAYPADQQRSIGHGPGTTSSVVTTLAAFESASAAPGVVLTLSPATSTVPPMRTVGEMRAESARRAQMVGVDRGGSQPQHPHQFHNAFGMMMSATTNATTAATVTATVSAAARIKEAEGSYFSGGVHGSGGSGIYGSGSVSKGRKPSVPSTSSTASVSSAGSGVRARMRLSRENQLYGEWYGGVIHGRRRPPFGDGSPSAWTRVS